MAFDVQLKSADFYGKKDRHCRCNVALMNFRKLMISDSGGDPNGLEYDPKELLHAVAGVCSLSLPDMELEAIYSSMTAAGSKTIVLTIPKTDVLKTRHERSRPEHEKESATTCTGSSSSPTAKDGESLSEEKEGESGDGNPFSEVFSDEESDSDSEVAAEEDKFLADREAFLSKARARRSMSVKGVESVGPEHAVVGCACVMRLSSKPRANTVQITLLAVRKKYRRMGIGRYLMQCCKDPDVIGHYDVLLAFSDHKAERFFQRHGFTDDPIITSKYMKSVDPWENSTLMCYIPPFSGPSSLLGINSFKSLVEVDSHLQEWRKKAIDSYSEQLSFMARLHHEVLMLHSKLQSQEELLQSLTQQLRGVQQEKALMEEEFTQYRKHAQELINKSVVQHAEQWLLDSTANR